MTSNRIRNRALLLASLLAVLAAASCSKYGSPTAPSGGGGTTGGLLNLGPFALGQSAVFTFPSAGTVGYHCIPHQSMGMVGTVQVDAAGADSLVVQLTSADRFAPSTAHIKPGGHVRWVNASSSTVHTVTSD